MNILVTGSTGTIGIDHAVAIVRIGYTRQDIGTHHKHLFRITGTDIVIGLNHRLYPSGTAEQDVIGHSGGIDNSQLLLES